MVKIDFEFDTPYGKFADALYFEDGAVPSDAEVEAMKQERVDNWIAVVTAPAAPVSKYVRDADGNLVLDEHGDPIPTGV